MLKNANRSFLGALCRQGPFAGSLPGVMCSLLLLANRGRKRSDTATACQEAGDDPAGVKNQRQGSGSRV